MRSIVLILAATATTACLFPAEPEEQLDISLTLSAQQAHADTGLSVRVTAVNRTGHTLHLTHANCMLGIDLVPPIPETELPNSNYALICTEDEPLDLAPGDSIVYRQFLGFRPWFSGQPPQLHRWPAGRYEVTGYIWDDGHVVRRTKSAAFDLVCGDPVWPEC